jgi:hypothetical protein
LGRRRQQASGDVPAVRSRACINPILKVGR